MKTIFLLTWLFFMNHVDAQERTVATGGENSSADGSISYSIGLIDYTQKSGSGFLDEGLQHPFEIESLDVENWKTGIEIKLFPNPTANMIQLELETENPTNFSYELVSSTGEKLRVEVLKEKSTTLSLIDLQSATYFLTIYESFELIRTYSIIKH